MGVQYLFHVLLCSAVCPFLFCNHRVGEERAGCFTFLTSWCLVTVIVLLLFLAVPWVGLQCAIP